MGYSHREHGEHAHVGGQASPIEEISQHQASFFSQPIYQNATRFELEEFVKTLKEIIFLERAVESTKIELALKSDFNIVDAFNMLDVNGMGSISQEDLKIGLSRNLNFVDFSNDDIFMLYRRFDTEDAGHLTF